MTPTSHDGLSEAGNTMSATDDIVWLVINLDRASDRLEEMMRHAEGLQLSLTRVAAIDGRLLPASLPGIDADLYRTTHGRQLRAGEIGCFVSHLRALRTFLATPSRFAMVLEDDTILTPEAVQLARSLTAAGAPDDWDQVKFESHHGRYGMTVRRLSDQHRLCALPFKAAGSAAYLINRAAAECLLDRMLPMRFPYDIAFDRSWEWGLRLRAVLPLPVSTTDAPSTIQSEAGSADRRRLTARARLETKVMRFASACRAWCFPTRRFGPGPTVGAGRRLADAMEAELARLAHGPSHGDPPRRA